MACRITGDLFKIGLAACRADGDRLGRRAGAGKIRGVAQIPDQSAATDHEGEDGNDEEQAETGFHVRGSGSADRPRHPAVKGIRRSGGAG